MNKRKKLSRTKVNALNRILGSHLKRAFQEVQYGLWCFFVSRRFQKYDDENWENNVTKFVILGRYSLYSGIFKRHFIYGNVIYSFLENWMRNHFVKKIGLNDWELTEIPLKYSKVHYSWDTRYLHNHHGKNSVQKGFIL